MSTDQFWEILHRQFAPLRERRHAALKITLLQEVETAAARNTLHNSRFPMILDRLAAEDLEQRAAELLGLLDAGMLRAGHPWSESMGEAAKSFVDSELETDVTALQTLQ